MFRTVVGLRGKDCVVLAVEKLVTSKLYEPGANRRIFNVDRHIGMVSVTNIECLRLLLKVYECALITIYSRISPKSLFL